mmetsp:Transcript_9895/g.23310  ORF Transcript_9895/g.23310 Transcript_9895/m.23310 type:complete len:161 (+) Transcript_9895:294-776(+)
MCLIYFPYAFRGLSEYRNEWKQCLAICSEVLSRPAKTTNSDTDTKKKMATKKKRTEGPDATPTKKKMPEGNKLVVTPTQPIRQRTASDWSSAELAQMLSTLGLKQGKLKAEREKLLDEWVRDKLDQKTVHELKVLLGKFNLKKTGNKEDLRSRLKEYLSR